jgi:hypothetical protein
MAAETGQPAKVLSLRAAVVELLQSFSDNLYEYPGQAKGDLYCAKCILTGETQADPEGVPYSQDVPPDLCTSAAETIEKALTALYGHYDRASWNKASGLVGPVRRKLNGEEEVPRQRREG